MRKNNWVEPEFVLEATEGRVHYDVELPKYTEPVLVNFKRLNLLRQLAGASIALVHGTEGKTSSESISVLGITGNGEAIAGKRKSIYVPEGTGKSFPRPKGVFAETVGVPGEVIVNTSEIANRISESRGSLRSAHDWSKRLNKGISGGFIALSDKNHITDKPFKRALLSSIYVADDIAELAVGDYEQAAIGLGIVAVTSLIVGAFERLPARRFGADKLMNLQPSPFMTFRIERVLTTRAIADYLKTVKPKGLN